MDANVKEKWVTALRSGEYEQGRTALNRENKFCCLGVLCDILGFEWEPLAGNISLGVRGTGEGKMNGQHIHHSLPPIEVYEAAGIEPIKIGNELEWLPRVVLSNGDRRSLSGLNDEGLSFEEIADLIEAQL